MLICEFGRRFYPHENAPVGTIKDRLTKPTSYLIHAPFFSEKKEDHQAKWAQMEQVKASGLARSIGVSNYLPEHLDWILETAQTPPSINQIEFHPYLQHGPLIDYHKQKVRKPRKLRRNKPTSTNMYKTGHRPLSLRPPNARHKVPRRTRRRRPG